MSGPEEAEGISPINASLARIREYFALQPDGQRSGFPNPRTVKLCQSNPAVWQQWLADVEKKLEKDPTLQVFSGSPNDGWASGHCTCENCRAWDHPDGEPRQFHWKGGNEIHPALSDRHVTFANRLAGLVKERYPDKDYYLMAQLAWNPRIDEQAVLDDYYRRAFGPAAEHVKAYFTVFETARQAHVAEHGGRAGRWGHT